MWKIGNINIKNKVVLAPMAGISNPTFIKICEGMNLGYAITELISAEAISRENKKTLEMLNGIENINIPVAIQLFGSEPETIAKAAKLITDLYQNVLIDINMGCPVPKVAIKNQAGSALLKNPEKVGEIVKAVVNAVNVPVTVKIRSGWDANSINAVEIAKICEESGASAITVHARTRAQGYSGKADWNIIKEVVQNVSIPVIGNGDVLSCYDAKRMLDETGCAAVMIGRGLLGNPWLIKESKNYLENGLEPVKISYDEKLDMMEYHLNKLCEDKSERQAVLEMRMHLLNYLKGMPDASNIKNLVCKGKRREEIINILESYRNQIKSL